LRRTRIEDFTDGKENGADLIKTIAAERRKELWLEGHRWFDLKRTTRTIVRKNCDAPATACDLNNKDYHWNFPIPLSEINANVNMVQNKGGGFKY
jgi:starch-binding outer membrane protein, SusD/RagB family